MGKYANIKVDAWEIFLDFLRKKKFLIEPFEDNKEILNEEGKKYFQDKIGGTEVVGILGIPRLVYFSDKRDDKFGRIKFIYGKEEN